MNYLKNILLSLSVAGITMIVMFGGYTIYAAFGENDEDPFDFTEPGLPFFEVADRYHGKMNEYLNEKIDQFNKLVSEEDKFFKEEEFVVPDLNSDEDFSIILEECEGNISTYCVSMGALDIYMQYVGILNNMLDNLALFEYDMAASGPIVAEDILRRAIVRNERIHEEMANAQEVMKLAMNTYNEYKLAYPMHRKYRQIIRELAKYRAVMKDITYNTARYPVRFGSVTSLSCE